jgi:hypothetical protein
MSYKDKLMNIYNKILTLKLFGLFGGTGEGVEWEATVVVSLGGRAFFDSGRWCGE